jgi:hypothetical protein
MPGKYYYFRQKLTYETDASKKLSLKSSYELGGYYLGTLGTFTMAGRYAPLPHITLSANYELNNFEKFDLRQNDLQTALYTARIRLATNPRLQLSTFYQYNSFDKRGRWNIRGSWEFTPLSFFYLVFNESHFQDRPDQNQAFITKLTYLKQF